MIQNLLQPKRNASEMRCQAGSLNLGERRQKTVAGDTFPCTVISLARRHAPAIRNRGAITLPRFPRHNRAIEVAERRETECYSSSVGKFRGHGDATDHATTSGTEGA